MATLQGQEIKDTYQALLKTDGNTTIGGTLQTITDGQGNATALSLSNQAIQNQGAFDMGLTGWVNYGGTSGSQYYLYNADIRTIYLVPFSPLAANPDVNVNLTSQFSSGTNVTFLHTQLGYLQGTVESSYFYNGEGSALTLIKLTTDPSNGISDQWPIYTSPSINPGVFINNISPSKGGEYIDGLAYNNSGGTSGSQYYTYNSANRSIYLDAYTLGYVSHITSSLTASFPSGNEITFLHSTLGPLSGVIESSYFYNGEGDPLTIIQLTTDPSNGIDDVFEGYTSIVYTTATNPFSFNTGTNNFTLGLNNNAKGQNNLALGDFCHVEGFNNTTIGAFTHGEGYYTTALGIFSHAEGNGNKAVGYASHAEGYGSIAFGQNSHAEGELTKSTGIGSHAEGYATTSIGQYSHAEGRSSIASGSWSHVEGSRTTTIGNDSHAEGSFTTAKGNLSHAEGYYTIASGSGLGSGLSVIPQHAEGRYNIPDTTSLLIVGNGTDDGARKNALAVTAFGTNNATASVVLQQVYESLNFANDTAAAAAGVPIGGIYRSGSFVLMRLV